MASILVNIVGYVLSECNSGEHACVSVY